MCVALSVFSKFRSESGFTESGLELEACCAQSSWELQTDREEGCSSGEAFKNASAFRLADRSYNSFPPNIQTRSPLILKHHQA